jgi:hypothetical protein
MRAEGVMRAKACLFRVVRKRAKSVWLWEQAADKTSRRAVAGVVAASGEATGRVTAGALDCALDSGAKPALVARKVLQKRRRTRCGIFV